MCRNEALFSRDSRYWRELAEGRVTADWWLLPQIAWRDNTRFADSPTTVHGATPCGQP
ncbi:hypothetical protein SHKM778_48510 [Streptomyces sp. KM77-8]|uniref:Uncharacterized protein n=1 Tax=Streptomyces haneummycinicus TaxID=3074435 RepID=A0AAT9HLZ7_9ACTN